MPDPPSIDATDGAGHRPQVLILSVVLTAVLGAALVGYALFVGLQWLGQRPDEPVNAALLIILAAGWGISLLACARGLHRRRRWSRAPVVTSVLLLSTVGWLLASGHGLEVIFGWVLLAVCVADLIAVLTPTVGALLD